jgi:hypothetical protein
VVEGAAHNIEQGMNGHSAAIAAMNILLGPIIGITLVLMLVFLPAAFLPGLTGRTYAQFALVIAATALISAINAMTLKPTQCALWLRAPIPPEQRNFFYRGFNAVYGRMERSYTNLVAALARHARVTVVTRQQRKPRQCRCRIHRPEGLEDARQQIGPAADAEESRRRAVQHRRGADHGSPAASDPRHRQCRRLRYAGSIEGRQL